jgi:hypothetical protein
MHRDRSRHRSSDDVPSSKDVVSSAREIKRNYVSFNFVELLDLFSKILTSQLPAVFYISPPFYSILIQKGPGHLLEMAALQRGL